MSPRWLTRHLFPFGVWFDLPPFKRADSIASPGDIDVAGVDAAARSPSALAEGVRIFTFPIEVAACKAELALVFCVARASFAGKVL